MEVVGRNQPCPCGSGKRYKECHGLLLNADDEPAPDAAKLVREGRSEYKRGRFDEAVRLFLAAARLIETGTVSAADQHEIWTGLNSALSWALYGIDGAMVAAKRADHARRLASLRRLQRDATPRVSIVVVATENSPGLRRALDSVCAQTYRNLELVLVDARSDRRSEPWANLLAGSAFPHALVSHAPAQEAMLLNTGVRAATGEFVTALSAADELSAERIRTFVEEVANRDGIWGFGDIDFVEQDRWDADARARVQRWRALLDGVPDLDTVGYAFIQPDCVAVTSGNLFFSRNLFDRLGGFRELPHAHLWDFCLRALWIEEPRFVALRLLRHRVAVSAPKQGEFEAEQLAMFGEFYDQACDEHAVAPNAYAPCIHHWGAHFLTAPFKSGHVLILGLRRIEQIAALLQRRSAARQPLHLVPGINLVGLAFAELGISESLRGIAHACAAGEIPFMVKDIRYPVKIRQADDSVKQYVADTPLYRCSLYCVNADMMHLVHDLLGDSAAVGGHSIGYWYWELDRVPEQDWADALARLDEIWVATEFVAAALRGATSKPVVKIPPPIEVRLSRRYARSDFALPQDCFLFLFSFDYYSFPRRKNPGGAIAAFRRAFGDRRDVGLVLKSINGKRYPERLAETRELVGSDERVVLLDEFFTRDETSGLQSVVDAFVSLHRSEGLGLGLAESMYQGKPVIGTRYSGNLEFMNDENSCLVDCELVPVGRGEYRYDDERFRWAEPDVDQAARLMRRLVDDAAFRDRIARAGQETIRTRFTAAATAKLIRERLQALGMI